jgi:drug/metabolite transporter (DMT)-like permease
MDAQLIALVLGAAVLHASWNAFVKVVSDRLVTMAVMNLTCAIVGLSIAPFFALPTGEAWLWLLGSTVIHQAYYYCLLSAYREGDLSHVYPIARGSAPLLVALVSGPLMGEALTTGQAVGVTLVSLGIAALMPLRGWSVARLKPVLYALGTGATIAAYSVCDARGVRLSGDRIGYIAWLFIVDGIACFAVAWAWRGRSFVPRLGHQWGQGVFSGLMSMLGYGIVIWCYSQGAVATIAALRETSVVFAALIGAWMLKEGFGWRRVAAAAVVATGVVVMNLDL